MPVNARFTLRICLDIDTVYLSFIESSQVCKGKNMYILKTILVPERSFGINIEICRGAYTERCEYLSVDELMQMPLFDQYSNSGSWHSSHLTRSTPGNKFHILFPLHEETTPVLRLEKYSILWKNGRRLG